MSFNNRLFVTGTTNSSSTTTGILIVSGGAGFGGRIYVNDLITGNGFNATSDYRIKTNVIDLNENYTIDNVRPVQYNVESNDKQNIGLIAHELQEFYPFLVTGEKDGEHLQTVNYIGLIPILINEIKSLKKIIRSIQKDIDKVQTDVDKINGVY